MSITALKRTGWLLLSGWLLAIVVVAGQTQGSLHYIAYVSAGEMNDDIFLTTPDNTETYNLTGSRSRDWHPTWSGNGTRIAFNSDRAGNPDIFLIDANGDNLMNLTNHPATDVSPDWSPFEDAIAFVSDRDGGFDLYIYRLDDSSVQRLTIDGNPKSDPDWSPDGQEITYWELVGGDVAQLVAIHLETGESRILIETGQNLWPAWSPDDTTILFHSGVDGDDDIFAYDLSDSRVTPITTGSSNQKQAAWSDDGTEIVFVSNQQETDNLYIMDAGGDNIRQVTRTSEGAHSPAWQPVAVELDFSNTARGQNVNRVEGEISSEAQRELGIGEARLFAPEQAGLDDIIRVRFELDVETDENNVSAEPTPDIPLRDARALDVYRYMGARLTGLDLSRFEIFPQQTDYLLKINEDRVNYWEWYLRPLDDSAVGRRFLAVEVYLPETEADGTMIQTVLDTIIFEVEILRGTPEAESSYIQPDLMPEPPLGLSIIYTDETLLAIIFEQETRIDDLWIGTSHDDYPLIDDFSTFRQTDGVVPAGTCLFYEQANAELVLPRACRSDNAFNFELSPVDIFWFDELENRLLDIIIRYNERAYPCNARVSRCDY